MSNTPMQTDRVSVGHLTELGREGDINFRFSNRSTPLEGIKGHQRVQKSRGKLYLSEYRIEQTIDIEGSDTQGGQVVVSGRIDGVGYRSSDHIFYVEEIKTVRVAVEDIPPSIMAMYWRQAKLYAYLLALENNLSELLVQLCFYHLDDKTETLRQQTFGYADLAMTFADAILLYSALRTEENEWVAQRIESMSPLAFPYSDYRVGQRDMAVSVYRAVSEKSQLVLQAPTGIGKTMATVYPALRALTPEVARRVFYVSARTSTQLMAQQAALDISNSGAKIRTVVITAKDKICFNPGQPCHPDHCEFAKDYYTGLHATVAEVFDNHQHLDRTLIEAAAREHELCPFELGLDLSRLADLVISDYNYVFDPVVYLRRFFEQDKKDSVVLIDEAHNLVDRGRDMFSAVVIKGDFQRLAKRLKQIRPTISKKLSAVNRSILGFKNKDKQGFAKHGHVVTQATPDAVLRSLEVFCAVAEEELRQELPMEHRDELLQCYFDSLRFLRTAESFNQHYSTLLFEQGKSIHLKLYCLNPSSQLGEVFSRLAASVCFSATLNPPDYFRNVLGTSDESKWYRLPQPFPADHLGVSIASYIDTSYRGRRDSLGDLIELIHTVLNNRKGNYLVFFPSYDYLLMAHDWMTAYYPQVNIIAQTRSMSDEARAEYLARFDQSSSAAEGVCGFAVMGGVFSEGIDLKGERLIGVIVVGVGLPQVGVERDLIRDHFPEKGFAYAYQYPGLIKVLQTAGRVIRDATDKGIVCLVDRRYTESRYRLLLPDHWSPSVVRSCEQLDEGLSAFWKSV